MDCKLEPTSSYTEEKELLDCKTCRKPSCICSKVHFRDYDEVRYYDEEEIYQSTFELNSYSDSYSDSDYLPSRSGGSFQYSDSGYLSSRSSGPFNTNCEDYEKTWDNLEYEINTRMQKIDKLSYSEKEEDVAEVTELLSENRCYIKKKFNLLKERRRQEADRRWQDASILIYKPKAVHPLYSK